MRHVKNLVGSVPGAQDLWILGARDHPIHIKRLYTSRSRHGVINNSAAFTYRLIKCRTKNTGCLCKTFSTAGMLWCQLDVVCQKLRIILMPSVSRSAGAQTIVINISTKLQKISTEIFQHKSQ